MAYEFKKLKDVMAIEAITDKANVLIEENGVIKKVNKSQVGDKINAATLVESVTENANVVVEEDGVIKRVHKSQIGMSEVSWNDLVDKPFGANTELIEVMPETTITGQFIEVSGLYVTEFQQPINLKSGCMYIVKINNDNYRVIGTIFENECYIGNPALAQIGEDTGEPFLYIQQGLGWNSELGKTITISINEAKETVTPLDYKYMPEGYPKLSIKTTEIMPITEVDINQNNGSSHNVFGTVDISDLFGDSHIFTEGETYIVNFDGVEYKCVAGGHNTSDGSVYFMGNQYLENDNYDDTGIPFFICEGWDFGPLYVRTYASNAGTHTFSIYQKEENITPIDSKYMPKDYPQVIKEICEIIPETTFEATKMWDEDNAPIGYRFETEFNFENESHTVIFDNVEYNTNPFIYYDKIGLGNHSLVDSYYPDTGEPFGLAPNGSLYVATPGEHTISIIGPKITKKPIDISLLPIEELKWAIDTYDLIITCQCSPSDIISDNNTYISGGSIDNAMAAFDEGRPPRVKIVYYTASGSNSATAAEITSVNVNKYYDEGSIRFLIHDWNGVLCRSIGIGPQGLHSFSNKIVEIQDQE